ncbi:hypothetical protein Glove_150g63 [Diversispora epigaea]|uniref:RWD domain-containing protein n=1 Tax=Diversispora epigaea TaxID=1348612 RepID=A0A397IZM8_9GLOM|nr:hypothetical protein Glove_150g63 [Diversispora epigaea]
MPEEDDNKTIQQEEILALTSIFGSDIFQLDPQDSLNQLYLFKLSLESDISSSTSSEYRSHSKNFITIKFEFPTEYPSTSPPNYKITSLYCGTLKIDKRIKNEIDKKFKELFIPGQVIIFEWIEWLKEFLIQKLIEHQSCNNLNNFIDNNNDDENNNVKEIKEIEKNKEGEQQEEKEVKEMIKIYKIDNNHQKISINCPEIISGESLEHKRSVFVAHLAPVNSLPEVNLVRDTLMLNKKVAKATHNIMAYRIIRDDGILLQDNDDDGETAAGGRLLHLLQLVDAKNIIVIVSRWYGGIQLGPDRFKDINNVARDLLEKCGYVGGGGVGKNGNKSGGGGDNKKTKKK